LVLAAAEPEQLLHQQPYLEPELRVELDLQLRLAEPELSQPALVRITQLAAAAVLVIAATAFLVQVVPAVVVSEQIGARVQQHRVMDQLPDQAAAELALAL
jgi:hypothetical protein